MKYRWLPVIVLAGITLWVLAGFAADPLLYAPEKDPVVSPFHQNPGLLHEGTAIGSDDMIQAMQHVIDGLQPIVVAFRANDIPAMERGLLRFEEHYRTLEHYAFQSGMTEGEIGTFLAGTKHQGDILRNLANQSETLDTLTTAGERAGDDADVQATVANQIAAVQETERTLLTRYPDNRASVLGISTKLGLDTRSYEQAQQEVQTAAREIVIAPVVKPPELPGSGTTAAPERITLVIEPATATYRDTVQIFGLVMPAGEEQNISVLLDFAPIITVPTDATGNYLAWYSVGRIRSGNHTISAITGNFTSAEQVLTVDTTGTTTTLTAVPGYHNWTETGAYCNGTVMANLPVRNAPVLLLANGQPMVSTITAENGTFREFLPLPEGAYTLTAQFSANDFPLSPSESIPVPVEIPSAPIRLADLVFPGVFILLALGAAAFWLLWPRQWLTHPEEKDPGGIPKEPAASGPEPGAADLPPEIGTLFARYEAILKEHGLSEAARRAYLDLAGRIAAHLRLRGFRTLTPREMSAACSSRKYAGIFDIFVESYERIRYGGKTGREDRAGFEEELQVADEETGEDRA